MTICTGEGFLHGSLQEVIQGGGTVCAPICSKEVVEFFCVCVTVEHVDCSQKLLNAQMNKAVDWFLEDHTLSSEDLSTNSWVHRGLSDIKTTPLQVFLVEHDVSFLQMFEVPASPASGERPCQPPSAAVESSHVPHRTSHSSSLSEPAGSVSTGQSGSWAALLSGLWSTCAPEL